MKRKVLTGWSEVNQQLADSLGIARTTLQSAVLRGEIPCVYTGTQGETRLVSVATARRWAKARKALR